MFRRPASLEAARAFSDPPLNVLPARVLDSVQLPTTHTPASEIVLGIRAHEFSLAAAPGQAALSGRVELAEISGSETFIHLACDDVRLVAQVPGVHDLPLNQPCTLYIRPASLYGFDKSGRLLFAPES